MKIVSLSEIPKEGVSHDPAVTKQVMLRNGDLPHLTNFSQATFAPGQTVTAHTHKDMAEVFLVESGEGVIIIDGQVRPLSAGVCAVVEAGETHELQNTGTRPMVVTYFGLLT
jgi:quercetin dioxygenase-like cupin family protein